MKTSSVLLFALIMVHTPLYSQGNFVEKGESAVGVGLGGAWNDNITNISGSAAATFWGRIDLGYSYGVLTTDYKKQGNSSAYNVSIYPLRGNKGSIFVSIDYTHTYSKQTLAAGEYFFAPGPMIHVTKVVETKNDIFGLSIGKLYSQKGTVEFIPVGNVSIYSSDKTRAAFLCSASLFVPVSKIVGVIPSFEVGYVIEGVFTFGLGVHLIYDL